MSDSFVGIGDTTVRIRDQNKSLPSYCLFSNGRRDNKQINKYSTEGVSW